MAQPKTVVFAINSLGGGGAESHTLRVVNHLDRSRFRPIVAVSSRGGNYEQFLSADVPIAALSIGRIQSSTANLFMSPAGLIPLVRRERPALVLPVMDVIGVITVSTLLALGKTRPKVAPIVQAPPSIAHKDSRFGRQFVLPGIRHLYHRADRVISLSHGVHRDLAALDARLADRVTVIHNACVDERIESPRTDAVMPETDAPVVLAAGRLTGQKGFPYLLDAFGEVRARTGAELWIIGEGPDRPALEAQIAQLDLGAAVKLLGFQKDPHAFMRRATVFCLSSVFEGFGNVVVEAMACGAPVVSTDCPYGPSEIITHDHDGVLVPVADPKALAGALVSVLSDPDRRRRLAENGRARSQAFHAKAISSAYADEMDRIIAC
ncbi:MAG: glycosyltransferase [Polyangiaceae bacterium]|nr:glycosyltransferase [Polyangiaceae bacterium]